MDFFFVEYRDPLVGLIILTILVFVVAVANYIWKIFANKDEEQKLEKFIKKFEMDNAHKELLRNSSLSFGNLSFLAEIFTKSGEFEKATQIYLIALEKCKDKQ
ncbi:tetratricopeptide repeat-containing protein, partial [Campylobacter jejuni]|nr:tetratricopeptide repeat-containing protein [Campylobacter jejuni]EAK7132302.1 tetratricopeptide repeat-containing protein [Campylobacter jejuni]EAK7225586.1 tetratricopeptide repeat-containing protein [Campylobacter jejuni]EIA7621973.1 tetratricopeptide repeat-containing protein [Campylobacter jejuni]